MSAESAPPTPTPESQGPSATQTEYAAWVHLRNIITNRPLQPGSTLFIPARTPVYMIPHIQGPHQAGLLTSISMDCTVTSFNLHELPGISTATISDYQWKYYQQGFQFGLAQKIAALTPAQAPAPAPAPVPVPEPARAPDHSTAPELNPPKVFKGDRSELKHFMLDFNMIY